jgi:hypothetical protein
MSLTIWGVPRLHVLHDAVAPCVWLHVCVTLGVQKRDGYGVQVLLELVCTYFFHASCVVRHARDACMGVVTGDSMFEGAVLAPSWAGPFVHPLKKTPYPHVRMDQWRLHACMNIMGRGGMRPPHVHCMRRCTQ